MYCMKREYPQVRLERTLRHGVGGRILSGMGRHNAVAGSHPANRMVAVAIVTMTLVFIMLLSRAFYGGRTVGVVAPPPERDVTARAHAAESDSDTDGLADWEEDLWGTDPNDPDTDGDGILDGAERATGQNPSGSGDTERFALDVTATEDLTATQVVGRELFGTYMQAFQDNPNLTSTDQEAIIDDALAAVADKLSIPQYTREDVRAVEASPVTRVAYIEGFKASLKRIQDQNPTENTALAMLAQGERVNSIAELTRSADIYTAEARVLANLPVPQDIVEVHVRMVAALYGYATSLANVAIFDKDPVLGIAGMSTYLSAQNEFTTATLQIMQYGGFDFSKVIETAPSEPTAPATSTHTP